MIYKNKNILLLPISIAVLTTSALFGSLAKAGSQGVDIYCVMRKGGNDHNPSWQAAYQAIKNERGGLFKISPKQAATIIVQQVVGSSEKYEHCIQYLGDLYPKTTDLDKTLNPKKTKKAKTNSNYIEERYSY